MKRLRTRFKRRFLRDQSGQSAVVIVVALFAVMALSAAGVETGHVYYAYRLLQASTNEAALAAGQAMPNIGTSSDSKTSGTAWGNLNAYSSISGAYNVTNMLSNDTLSTVSFFNSSTATSLNVFPEENTNSSGSVCTGSTSASWCNAVKVTQTAKVNLWFGGLVGMRSMTLSATAEAAMAGGHPPYNIAVVIDTTSSMNGNALANDDCPSGSEISCAVYGFKQMLLEMYPCLSTGSCTSSSEEADGIALFVFPAIGNTAANINKDTVCDTSNPSIDPYTFPVVTTGSGQNLVLPSSGTIAATYEVSGEGSYGFDTYYKSSDAATALNGTDPVAVASGGGTATGHGSCAGLQAPGGEGTYYAQVIKAAQTALLNQQSYMMTTYSQPTQNVMIILSDGNATACNSQANTSGGANGNTCSDSQIVAENCPQVNSAIVSGHTVVTCGSTTISQNGGSATLNCPAGGCSGTPLNGTGNTTTNPESGTGTSPTCHGYTCAAYPSALGECGQAVYEAQLATAAGTAVYTVAMGSPTSAGSGNCGTDQPTGSYTLTGLTKGATTWPSGAGNGGQAGVTGGSPCNAISAMASGASYFYSDDQGGCKSTVNGTFESMASIFSDVSKHFQTSRLMPAGAP